MKPKDAPVVEKGRAVRGALPLPINVHEREEPLAEDSRWADIQPFFSSQGTNIHLVVWGRYLLLLEERYCYDNEELPSLFLFLGRIRDGGWANMLSA